jgi:hypothetical protein
VPVEVARAAFIAAAKESGIHVRRSRLKKLVAIVAGTDDTETGPTEQPSLGGFAADL